MGVFYRWAQNRWVWASLHHFRCRTIQHWSGKTRTTSRVWTQHERPLEFEPKSEKQHRFVSQSWEALKNSNNPVFDLAKEFEDIFPESIPPVLPADRGVRHEIDLVPGSKYCITRQWPLPRDQAIDKFFEGRLAAGHVRESISPHSSPTFCLSL